MYMYIYIHTYAPHLLSATCTPLLCILPTSMSPYMPPACMPPACPLHTLTNTLVHAPTCLCTCCIPHVCLHLIVQTSCNTTCT